MNESNAAVFVEESADLVCTPAAAPLTGELLERELRARDRRAHLQALDAVRAADNGWPDDPDLAFWKHHDEP